MFSRCAAGVIFFLASCVLVASLSAVTVDILSLPKHSLSVKPTRVAIDNEVGRLHWALKTIQLQSSALKEREGDLLMRKSFLFSPPDVISLTQAATAYRYSLDIEPAKADLWAKFALSKAMLHQFDVEFYNAFQKAFKYGGWEVGPTEIIIRIGLANMRSLDVESLFIVKESLRRLYSIRFGYVLNMARDYGQLHMACLWVRDFTPTNVMCQKEL